MLLLAPPLVFVSRVFRPVIWALNAMANGVLRLFRVEPKDEATSTFTLDEVAGIVEQSTREGVLTDTTGALSNAFEFTAKKVQDVEVPMAADRRCCRAPRRPTEVQRAVAEHGFSRYVLLDADGEPAGYVHLKDVMDLTAGDAADQPVPGQADPATDRGAAGCRPRGRPGVDAARRVARGALGGPAAARSPGCCSWRTSSRSWSVRSTTRPAPRDLRQGRRIFLK